ncbi:MAG: hypothetical protein ACR2OW_14830 [Methyloligellaceae bacterium]
MARSADRILLPDTAGSLLCAKQPTSSLTHIKVMPASSPYTGVKLDEPQGKISWLSKIF